MTAFSDYLENKIINHIVGNGVFAYPGTVYMALFTSGALLESNQITHEVSGGGYVRVAVTFDGALNGTATTPGDVIFPTATASWGTVEAAALMDSSSGGNVLIHGTVTSTPINIGDQFKFEAGNIQVSLS